MRSLTSTWTLGGREIANRVVLAPLAAVCQECGSRFSLRSCATCGHVGCCESQAGHARAHALNEGHPVIEQLPNGFTWCYAERQYVG